MEIIRERDYRKKGEISPFSRYSRVTPFPSNRIRHDARRSERRENSVPLGRNFGWMENGWRREARETFSSTALKFNRVPSIVRPKIRGNNPTSTRLDSRYPFVRREGRDSPRTRKIAELFRVCSFLPLSPPSPPRNRRERRVVNLMPTFRPVPYRELHTRSSKIVLTNSVKHEERRLGVPPLSQCRNYSSVSPACHYPSPETLPSRGRDAAL